MCKIEITVTEVTVPVPSAEASEVEAKVSPAGDTNVVTDPAETSEDNSTVEEPDPSVKVDSATVLPVDAPAIILTTSALMVSKLPTYSLKRIAIPRNLTIFLLLGIGIYFSLLIFYTFKTLFFSGLFYLILIPVSYIHYKHKAKTSVSVTNEDTETEDIL